MATRDPKLALLRQVPGLEGIGEKQLAALSRAFEEVTLEPGEVFVRQGRRGLETFLIVDGTAAVTRGSKQIAVLGPGELVGEMAVIDRGERSATVRAKSRLRLLVINAANFDALLERPSVRTAVGAVVSKRLRDAQAGR